jgi:hypothetical protein
LTYASIPKQTAKKVVLVFMVAACVSKDLGDWWRARENRRTNDRGKGDECSNRKGQTKKMTLSTEREKLKDMACEREKNRART